MVLDSPLRHVLNSPIILAAEVLFELDAGIICILCLTFFSSSVPETHTNCAKHLFQNRLSPLPVNLSAKAIRGSFLSLTSPTFGTKFGFLDGNHFEASSAYLTSTLMARANQAFWPIYFWFGIKGNILMCLHLWQSHNFFQLISFAAVFMWEWSWETHLALPISLVRPKTALSNKKYPLQVHVCAIAESRHQSCLW